MDRAGELGGERQSVELAQGTIRYRDSGGGGSGETIVFIHGLLVNGLLWDPVTNLLGDSFRCVVPDLPLGSHLEPMHEGADLGPPGLARLIADFIEALGLERVTLVANDTGGAISQLVVTRHPERIARLVLTNCDAYEDFLPPFFRPLQWAARVPGLLTALIQPTRLAPVRRSQLAYGSLIKNDPDDDVLATWGRPFLADRGVRRDTIAILKGISPSYTLEAAPLLAGFEGPALLAWAPEDRFFKIALAERLVSEFRDGRLERIDDSYTFVSQDQPERLAALIGDFAGGGAG
ncbi:MAG: alpha/beta hydrolase [Solirubrobacterales bacterium]|nr:alpha/beta hydrolase [Solirubrobacterales bacterium]